RVLRCPLVAIRDAPEPAPVLAFARAFAGGACDDLILSTGEGLRRILACIERHEPELRAPFLAALARVRKITRGPKPARALGEVDAIAFTSTPQVERLFAVAPAATVSAALSHTLVAAVGPVVAEALARHGVSTRLMPEESFFLKPLTTALEEALRAPV